MYGYIWGVEEMNKVTTKTYYRINFLFWFFVFMSFYGFLYSIVYNYENLFHASKILLSIMFCLLAVKIMVLGLIAFGKPKRKRKRIIKQDSNGKKHFAVMIDGDIRYMCNRAVNVSMKKCTTNKKSVTCKNCLKVLK